MSQSIKQVLLSLGFKAASDLSTGGVGPNSSYQYTAVIATATAFGCDKAGAGATLVIGILQNAPKINSAAEVAMIGISQLIVDGNASAIAPGDKLKTDASGRGIKTTTDRDPIFAVALEPSTAQNDQIAVMLLDPGTTIG